MSCGHICNSGKKCRRKSQGPCYQHGGSPSGSPYSPKSDILDLSPRIRSPVKPSYLKGTPPKPSTEPWKYYLPPSPWTPRSRKALMEEARMEHERISNKGRNIFASSYSTKSPHSPFSDSEYPDFVGYTFDSPEKSPKGSPKTPKKGRRK